MLSLFLKYYLEYYKKDLIWWQVKQIKQVPSKILGSTYSWKTYLLKYLWLEYFSKEWLHIFSSFYKSLRVECNQLTIFNPKNITSVKTHLLQLFIIRCRHPRMTLMFKQVNSSYIMFRFRAVGVHIDNVYVGHPT